MPVKRSAAEAAAFVDEMIKKLREAVGPGYREMIASYGGAEAYTRWVRGYDEPPSAVDIWIDTGKLPDVV